MSITNNGLGLGFGPVGDCPTTTTTTVDPLDCNTGVVDDDLVCHIKQTLNISRVYHLTAYQQLDPNAIFPCVVYELQDDQAFHELDGESGAFNAVFAVYVICPDAVTLRLWSRLLARSGRSYTDNGWMRWDNDTEHYEIPAEMQELGEKQTMLICTIIRGCK